MSKSVVVLGAVFSVALSACGGVENGPLYPTGEPVGEDSRIAVSHAAVPRPQNRVMLSDGTGASVSNAPPPGGPTDPSQIPPPPGMGPNDVGGDGMNGGVAGPDGSDPNASNAPPAGYDDTDPSALQDFREPLAPYGTWVDDASYGTVWMPREDVVGDDFAPYVSGGHWTYDDQYTWVSDYSWGWAPFHYGRWVWMQQRGWGWIPGREYSGGWVAWRTGPVGYGYVGWAPQPPSWYWYGGAAVGVNFTHPVPYVFCAAGEVFNPQIQGRIVTGPQVAQVGAGTRPYTPATPSVNGSGNGSSRTTANPSVNGTGSGPGITALARLNAGPNPRDLGITNPPGRPLGNAGLDHAVAFASPRTAAALGGHAPSLNPAMHFMPQNGGASSFSNRGEANLPPRLRPIVSSPTYVSNGVAYNPPRTIGRTEIGSERMPERLPSSAARAYAGTSRGQYGSSQSSASYSHPVTSSTPAVHASPSYSPHTSGSTGGSAPSSGGGHSGGGHHGGGHR